MKPAALPLVCLLFTVPSFAQQGAAPKAASAPNTPAAANAAAATQAVPSAAPQPDTLLDGTPVKLRLAENLSSESAKTGQSLSFEVTQEIMVEGVVVIPKGAVANATITNAAPKKNMGRGGKLDVNVDSLRLIDGEKAQLRAIRDAKGGGHVGAMTGAMVATAVVFFPAAPLFLFMKGKSVEIPKGTEITAFVQGDMHLEMARMVPPGAVTAPASIAESAAAAPAALSSVTVDASVAGADIEVDGSFVGSTPSTLALKPGQHTITIKKKAYADWTRTLNVSGSAVKLTADLEAKP